MPGVIQTGLGVGFERPGSAQLVEHDLERAQLRVPGGLASGELGGVGWAEVGPVAAEDRDPLLTRVLDGVGDQVRDVGLAAAGHADVGRRGTGVLSDDQRARLVVVSPCTPYTVLA